VALVPITPIFPVWVSFTASPAAGPITPITGTGSFRLRTLSDKAEDVLQATMSILMPFASRKRAFSNEYRVTV
jgi:hypothetical protein